MTLRMSENIDQLAAALCAAQLQVRHAIANAQNPFFDSEYSDLPEVLDTVHGAFSPHGLVLRQIPFGEAPRVGITNIIMHKSGQWMADELTATPVKNDPQAVGSCLTYLRRYGAMAAGGIGQKGSDDDGNAASDPKPKQRQETRSAPVSYTPKAGAIAGEYTPNFGKFKGQAIKNISPRDLQSYVDFLKKSERKSPAGEEFITNAESYLAGDEEPPVPEFM